MDDIRVWHITSTQSIQLDRDAPTLDAVTRQLPEGYYSTFRTYDGGTRVLRLKAHLRRLFDPVSAPEIDEDRLRRELRAVLEQYRPGEARVRAVLTSQGQAYLALEPLQLLPREVYDRGVRVETTELQREHPELKSTAFIGRSDAERKHIAREGIFDALLVKDGRLLEGLTSNFFYVKYPRAEGSESAKRPRTERAERLGTAGGDILLGVTRRTVIEIARGRGLKVEYKPLKRDQLDAAREAFITSSSRGIVPVIQIDDVSVGEGSPGPISRELMAAYEAYVLENAEPI